MYWRVIIDDLRTDILDILIVMADTRDEVIEKLQNRYDPDKKGYIISEGYRWNGQKFTIDCVEQVDFDKEDGIVLVHEHDYSD